MLISDIDKLGVCNVTPFGGNLAKRLSKLHFKNSYMTAISMHPKPCSCFMELAATTACSCFPWLPLKSQS